MFTDNYEVREDEIDQEVTYDARNKTTKTVLFSQQSSQYSQSQSHNMEGICSIINKTKVNKIIIYSVII